MHKSKKSKSLTKRKMLASEPVNGSLPSVMVSSAPSVGPSSSTPSMMSCVRDQQHQFPSNSDGAKERKERQMRRLTADMDDLRAKLERDKTEALNHQKEAMNRAFRVQMTKLLKEKEELQRKCQTLQQAKEQTNKTYPGGSASSTTGPLAPEMQKLIHENAVLRIEKKKQDEQLQMMKESEQNRFENMRSLLDDKARELITFQKQLRQQIARLREESRAKDRVISHLEAELRMQTGRAQQFRDILEQSLLSAGRCTNTAGQHQNERDDLIARERQLQIQVEDLQETMRHQQDAFAQEKKELLRRLSDTERQQGSLRQRNKQVLTRNVELSTKSQELVETVKNLQQAPSVPAVVNNSNNSNSNNNNNTMSDTNLKRSLTRPNVHHLSKNDKQRRIEYVQQIQKLRKEQRYYSMWELPPLLEVETDTSGNEGADSEGSLSPAATSGVTSCSSDSAWSEDTRRELEVLFSQLSREHSELQRNYQLLHEKLRQLTCFSDADAANVNYATLQADYNAARARIRDLEEILQLKNSREREASENAKSGQTAAVPSLLEIQAKFVREKHVQQTQMAILVNRLEESKRKYQTVQAELNEARDQNELLEFRILELEESQERAPSPVCYADQRDRKDVCTDTDSDDVSVGDSGITSLASLVVDCPSPVLPRSPCSSGSSPDSDYLTEKISSVKAELQLLVSSLNDPSQKTVLAQLQALLGVCQSRLVGNKSSPNASDTSTDSNWDWQLQESGIFEEEHHRQSTDGSTQTEPLATTVVLLENKEQQTDGLVSFANERLVEDKHVQVDAPDTDSRAVQTSYHVRDFQIQTDGMMTEEVALSCQSGQERPDVIEGSYQTEEQIMSLTEFRDIESYYVQQIEMLQKEKSSHRKKFQASRDETAKSTQQLELLGRQFQERERQFEEILQKNCRAFERELELAREMNANELSTLKECLQLVWHEVKDYASVTDMPKTSIMEFTQALISSLHGICNELGQLRVRVVDLAEMEQAFQTTLQQADGLVHHIEEKHLQRIRELECTEHELRHQLDLQQHHQAVTSSRRSSDETDGSLEIKLQELEQENDALTQQVGKCQELQDYCQQLHGRLEEYEQREKNFHLAVQEAERRFSVREKRFREEIDVMKAELDKCRENESTWRQRLEQRDGQICQMRSELEAEQKTISALEVEVKELQSKLHKDDASFRNEVTKLRLQLNTSMAQLNELESLNCQLREQIVEHQNTISSLQRSLDRESCQNETLAAENSRLAQAQMDLMANCNGQSTMMTAVAKPLTEELFEVEVDDGCPTLNTLTAATLDDFQEISLPSTPTVVDGCNDVFEEHFKVLESLENYLETQHLVGATAEDNDESGISTSPSIHENENLALLEAQLSQLRTEKHFLLNSVVNSQKKDEVIQILVDQLKYNAPRQYLIETAAHIRKISTTSNHSHPEANQHRTRDKDIDRICNMLEAPIDLTTTNESCSLVSQQQPSASLICNYDVVIPQNKVVRRQTTVTVLPEEDPLLSPPSDLKITRKVGTDGLVIAWLPSPDSECVGYLICVNGQEAHRGRNAQRTKAVLSGLDLHSEMDICIYSLSVDGLVSSPATVFYSPQEWPTTTEVTVHQHPGDAEPVSLSSEPNQAIEVSSPREVVVQTFYTNSSVTVRSSRRVIASAVHGSRIPVRSSVP